MKREKLLTLIQDKLTMDEVTIEIDKIYQNIKSEIKKDFRTDIYLSVRKPDKKTTVYNFDLPLTENNIHEYSLIHNKFNTILKEKQRYEN